MGKAIDTSRDNLGYFNPPNVYRPAIIDIRLVGEYSAEDGATNTYRITQNDGKIFEFDVKNGSGGSAGRSVASVEQIQISTESLGKNIARINLSDGTYTDVEIRNGAQGQTGPQGERGPAGIDQVEATVDNAVGTPSVDTSVVDGKLHLDFHNMKGVQGEPAVAIEDYVTVEATPSTTAATDVLPATGSADTLYRVACWDGAQYDTTVYSVYGWYDGAYKFLEKKEVGIDDEPTTGSQNFVKSGGVAAKINQLGQKLIKLAGFSYTQSDFNVGDIYFNTSVKQIRLITSQPSGYVTIPYYDGAIYTYNNELYIWDGTNLINKTLADNLPIQNSNNLVKSGGVYDAIKALKDSITVEKNTTTGHVDVTANGSTIPVLGEKDYNDIALNFGGYIPNMIAMTNGGFISCNVNVGDTISLTPTSNNNWRYAIVNCAENDVIYITGKGGTGPKLFCFLDVDNKLLYKASDSENNLLVPTKFIAPENAAKLIINDEKTGRTSYKGEKSIREENAQLYLGEDVLGLFLGNLIDVPDWIWAITDSNQKVLGGFNVEGKFTLPEPSNQDDILQEQIDSVKTKGDADIAGNAINGIEFVGSPSTVLSKDSGASTLDDIKMLYGSILKVSNELYYLYYEAFGTGAAGVGDDYYRICVAYSTDGATWQRGFPDGVTPPHAGTNLLGITDIDGVSKEYGILCQHIFRVQDNEYPYRMVANDQVKNSAYLWKSADAINFVNPVRINNTTDTQLVAIPRGDVLKIYCRAYATPDGRSDGIRRVGTYYVDLWGNMLSPRVVLFGTGLYQTAAHVLDNNREMLFPTHFEGGAQDVRCYIVDGTKIYEKDFTAQNNVLTNNGYYKMVYVVPGLVSIGTKMYMFYLASTRYHDSPDEPSNEFEFKMIEVKLKK